MSEQAFHTEKIETLAGVYTVELYPDYEPALHPLEDDNEVFAALIEYSGYGGRWDESTNTLDSAGRAGDVVRGLLENFDHDTYEVGRRYVKWSALAGSPWILAMGGQSASQSDYYRYALLANGDELTNAEESIKNVMADYHTYASGSLVGFVTLDPAGEMVESMWGFYSDEDALDEGRSAAEGDAVERNKKAIAVALDRIEKANLVGAGFVGIV